MHNELLIEQLNSYSGRALQSIFRLQAVMNEFLYPATSLKCKHCTEIVLQHNFPSLRAIGNNRKLDGKIFF